jgi:pyruvate/2-oxoacid:ferredoxin oxidoreductase alpha subunit
MELHEAMGRVPGVFEECRAEFKEIFGRDPGGAIETFETDDAEVILLTSSTVATTAHEVVKARRAAGQRVGMVKMRMFRPFPEDELVAACAGATKIGVLDRDYAAGLGGVWWQDTRAAFQGRRDDVLIQDYLTGIGGGDVTPELVHGIVDDLTQRDEAGPPVWTGVRKEEEVAV